MVVWILSRRAETFSCVEFPISCQTFLFQSPSHSLSIPLYLSRPLVLMLRISRGIFSFPCFAESKWKESASIHVKGLQDMG